MLLIPSRVEKGCCVETSGQATMCVIATRESSNTVCKVEVP